MAEDKKYQRILDIIAEGTNQERSGGEIGEMTQADYDELAILASSISEQLPKEFLKLKDSAFDAQAGKQVRHFQRLERILSVYDEHSLDVRQGNDGNVYEGLPTFSLTAADRNRVLDLCKQMRKIVFASDHFDIAHKKLLLNRITAVEKQVLDKRGLLDVVRAGVAEVGETLGKFGKDIKPLTDRFNEVLKITRDASPEYSQIPAPEEILQIEGPAADEDVEDSSG